MGILAVKDRMKNRLSLSLHQTTVSPEYEISLASLLQRTFGINHLPKVVHHHYIVSEQKLVAYCASRTIKTSIAWLDGHFDHLGLVCVVPELRGMGLGSFLIEELISSQSSEDVYGAVLNCGLPVQRFYEKVGFRVVSDIAGYYREGCLVIDHDPVLAIPYDDRLLLPKNVEMVVLGQDL